MNNMQKQIRVTSAVRWTARAWSIVTIILVLAFLIGEGFNPKQLTPAEWIGFIFFPIGICLGLVVAWRKEGWGAIIVIGSLLAFYITNFATVGTFPKGWAWEAFAAPGFLFALCWYRSCKVVSPAA
jgi:glucose-6-phosphate-specific signal transduction histidine kinase